MEQTKRTQAQTVRSITELTVNIGMSHKPLATITSLRVDDRLQLPNRVGNLFI
jgi:hypothetical protein